MIQMLVELGVQDALGQRLLKIVQKPVTGEDLGWVTPLQEPIQYVLVDGHAVISFDPSSHDPRTRFPTVPGCQAAR